MEDWYVAYMPLILFSPGVQLLLICAITAFIAFRMVLSRKRECKHLQPPGPRGLPIIGHLHLLGKLPHRSLCEMSKIHGPLMSLRFGSVPVVVVSSPAMAQQVLQTHDHAFANRMPTAAAHHIFGTGKDIVFSQPTAYWKLMRRLIAAKMSSAHGMEFFRPVRMEETRLMMRSVLADCRSVQSGGPQPQQMRTKLQGATTDIIMRMLIGKKFSELSGKQDEQGCSGKVSIVELIEETLALLSVYNVGDYLPCVAWMDLQGCERRSKRLAADIRAAFEEIIEAHRLHHRDGRPPKDFLDMLLQAADTSDMPIHIMEVLLQSVIGGAHTSAITVEWALADLLSSPEKMRRVQEEMDQAVGMERTVQEEDIGNLPFLRACVKETMRLHPIGPLLIPHRTNQDLEIWGFQIPANTLALVNTWAIGRDPKVWADPTTYSPERFLQATTSVDVNGHHFELLPFGSGRRQCPGWRLGLLEVHTILASLLQGFSWSISPSHRLDMSEQFRLDLCLAVPLVACAMPRLRVELF